MSYVSIDRCVVEHQHVERRRTYPGARNRFPRQASSSQRQPRMTDSGRLYERPLSQLACQKPPVGFVPVSAVQLLSAI